MMHRTISAAVFVTLVTIGGLVVAGAPVMAQSEQKQEPKKDASKGKTDSVSMTGCVDEQEGKYLLLDGRTRDPIAHLEAEGFETEGFAKHVGHRVTVRGISNPGGALPVFRVRSIQTIDESCGAQ